MGWRESSIVITWDLRIHSEAQRLISFHKQMMILSWSILQLGGQSAAKMHGIQRSTTLSNWITQTENWYATYRRIIITNLIWMLWEMFSLINLLNILYKRSKVVENSWTMMITTSWIIMMINWESTIIMDWTIKWGPLMEDWTQKMVQ